MRRAGSRDARAWAAAIGGAVALAGTVSLLGATSADAQQAYPVPPSVTISGSNGFVQIGPGSNVLLSQAGRSVSIRGQVVVASGTADFVIVGPSSVTIGGRGR